MATPLDTEQTTYIINEPQEQSGNYSFEVEDVEVSARISNTIATMISQLENSGDANKFVVFNSDCETFISYEIEKINFGPEDAIRPISIHASDDTSVYGDLKYALSDIPHSYHVTSPDYLQIIVGSVTVSIINGKIKVTSKSKEDISAFAQLETALNQKFAGYVGQRVDPYEILYGDATEEQLIREVLGEDAVIDSARKLVFTSEVPLADNSNQHEVRLIQRSYKETLARAKEFIGAKLLNRFSSLPSQLKKKHSALKS